MIHILSGDERDEVVSSVGLCYTYYVSWGADTKTQKLWGKYNDSRARGAKQKRFGSGLVVSRIGGYAIPQYLQCEKL